MSRHVRGSIPNLVNGVSQQTPSTRLSSQAEAVENCYTTIIKGCEKRPRTDYMAELDIDLPANAFTHIIIRDQFEKYIAVFLDDGSIRVWDFDGNEKTVTNNGAAYLTGLTDPSKELRALTVADHTFIVNKNRTVAMGLDKSPTRPYEALAYVLAGSYGHTYKITIHPDGAPSQTTVSYKVPDGENASHAPFSDASNIADELQGGLITAGFDTAPWALGRYGSCVYIRNVTTDFGISTQDGAGGRNFKLVKGKAQKFSDLPTHAPAGVVVEVTGDEASGFDNYWLEYTVDGSVNGDAGVWEESVAPDVTLGFDADTMPHTLVRNADGTFTFKPAVWDERGCGDEDAVPDPSFVGQKIQDLFFYKNRLGFLTNENVVMSEAGKFFNFWRTTLTALLDTDPIDVAVSHVKVSLLRHAVPFSDVLLLFSDFTQFRLAGNELFTPKTVNAQPLSEMPSHPAIRPVTAATSLYFLVERQGWAGLVEYFIDKAIETAETEDVSAHAPAYIPAGVQDLVTSPDLDLVIASSKGEPNALFPYKYHWAGQEKVQSSWSRWTFPGVDRIADIAFDGVKLILVVKRGSRLFIEALNCEPGIVDYGESFTTYLDRHVLVEDGVYDPLNDETTFSLPYEPSASLKVVTATGGEYPAGVELPIVSFGGSDVTVSGDYSTEKVRIGLPYTSVYEFSEIFHRDREGRLTEQSGRLQVLSMTLVYSDAAYFRVEVTAEGRDTRTYPFSGRIVSDPANIVGQVAIDSGKFSFPVMSKSDRVKIRVVNDTWAPSAFISATWRGTWNPSSRQQ